MDPHRATRTADNSKSIPYHFQALFHAKARKCAQFARPVLGPEKASKLRLRKKASRVQKHIFIHSLVKRLDARQLLCCPPLYPSRHIYVRSGSSAPPPEPPALGPFALGVSGGEGWPIRQNSPKHLAKKTGQAGFFLEDKLCKHVSNLNNLCPHPSACKLLAFIVTNLVAWHTANNLDGK